jgi:hypothetical protein
MGFGGGGGGALQNHVHNSVPLQGGPLDFANDTIASLNVGSTTFSDGAALQELVIGNAGDALVVNGAGTAPEWGAAAGTWQQVFTDTRTSAASTWTNTFTAIPQNDNAMFCLQVQCGFSAASDLLLQFHDSSGVINSGYYSDGLRLEGGADTVLDQNNVSNAMILREGGSADVAFNCTVFITMGNSNFTNTDNERFTWHSEGYGGLGGMFGIYGGSVDSNPITSFNGITLLTSGGNFEIGSKVTLWKVA